MIAEHATRVPSLAIVRSTRGWARTLHRFVVDHGGAVVKTRPLEERQAIEEDYDVLIVDDISSLLTAYVIEELHRRGRRVLGVYDPDEFSPLGEANAGRQRLERMGVDGIIDSTAAPEDFVRVVRDLAPVRAIDYTEGLPSGPGADDPFMQLMGGQTAGKHARPATLHESDRPRGHITVVLGTSGGVGATEVAIELARALGKRGERAVIIDGDEMVPSLAQRLGLQLHPNIHTAIDVIEHGAGRLIDCLTTIGSNLEAMVGIPHPRDWVDLRGPDVEAVVREIARGRHQVVVNASPSIEDLTPFGSADRFAASRTAVGLADSLVLVSPPTPMGITRLIDRAAELNEVARGTAVHVVINRAPNNARNRKEITQEIMRSFKPASLHFAPTDSKVEGAAWQGTLVPSGQFTQTIDRELAAFIPQRVRSGKRRSPAPQSAGSTQQAKRSSDKGRGKHSQPPQKRKGA